MLFYRLSVFMVLISFISAVDAFAQKGEIRGSVIDSESGETIIGANVVIKGTTIGASTDMEGRFSIAVDPGTYEIEISFVSYKPNTLENVEVRAGEVKELNISLEEEAVALEGVDIKARRTTDTEISMINSIKASNLVVAGITRQQIERSQDKDASEVVRRVPGITILDNQFVVVRGLQDRYNTVWMNNAPTPSFESDKKSFSFDVVPSSMIDRMVVYKTPAPELPADFSGASIHIFTKSIPDQNLLKLSYSAGFNQNTTMHRFNYYQGGDTDWLGFDDGTRALPDRFPSTEVMKDLYEWTGTLEEVNAKKQELERITRTFNDMWDVDHKNAPVNQSLSLEFSRRFNLGNASLGNITSLTYKNSYDRTDVFKAQFGLADSCRVDTGYTFNNTYFTNKVMLGALHNWSLQLKGGTLFEFRNFFNQIGHSSFVEQNGLNNYWGSTIKNYELGYMSRTIYSGQFSVKPEFGNKNLEIEAIVGYSFSDKNEPDNRRISSTLTESSGSPYDGEYKVNFPFEANPDYSGRLFLTLDEQVYNSAFNFSYAFDFGWWEPEIKSGVYYENKNREFIARNIGYRQGFTLSFDNDVTYLPLDSIFIEPHFRADSGILIADASNADDSYKALNDLIAGYVGVNIPLGGIANIYGGVRVEKNYQKLYDFQEKPDPTDTAAIVEPDVVIDTLNFFPSVNMSYNINEEIKVRAGFGMTVNRPEFREIAPYAYYDFINFTSNRGEPDLKNAYISNYDLRLDWYPSPFDMFTIGGFYKKFTNPIEYIKEPNSTDKPTIKPYNAREAEAVGFEVDIKTSFKRFKGTSSFFRHFHNLGLVANTSFIWAQVTDTAVYVWESERSLQGQSPYIFNGGVFYQNNKAGWMASALYNVIGKRIIFVGSPNDPHTYELPHHLIDLTVNKSFGEHIMLKFGIRDLLSNKVEFVQYFPKECNAEGEPIGSEEQEVVVKSFRPGRRLSFGITYKF